MPARLMVGGALALTALTLSLVLERPTGVLAAEPTLATQDDASAPVAADAPANRTAPFGVAVAPLVVEVRTEADGSEFATVVGANVSVRTICDEVAKATGRLLFGFLPQERDLASPLVTVELRDRPLDQVLEYVLGTAGLVAELSNDILGVRQDPAADEREALLMRALAGYSRATYAAPGHGLAAAARLAQGEIEEQRGLPQAALSHYQLLVDSYPASPLVLDAHVRSGMILQGMGEWGRAIQEFRTVSEISPGDLDQDADGGTTRPLEDFVSTAKLEIARCNREVGRSDFALLILNVLDREHPPTDRTQVMSRSTLRALCYLDLGSYIEALDELDELERGAVTEEVAHLALEIRARCFDAMDLRKEAAKAWLIHARLVEEPRSSQSYERASELFLSLDDYLGVLLVAGEVRDQGVNADVSGDERIARAALNLEVSVTADNASVSERVDAAAIAADANDWNEVTILLGPLFGELELAPEHLRDDIALGWADAVFHTESIDAAIAGLRKARALFARLQPEDVARLDQKAAQLFESEGDFDAAYEAYEGNY